MGSNGTTCGRPEPSAFRAFQVAGMHQSGPAPEPSGRESCLYQKEAGGRRGRAGGEQWGQGGRSRARWPSSTPNGAPRSSHRGGRVRYCFDITARGGWVVGGGVMVRTLDLSGQSMLASPAWIRRLCSANSRSLLAPLVGLRPLMPLPTHGGAAPRAGSLIRRFALWLVGRVRSRWSLQWLRRMCPRRTVPSPMGEFIPDVRLGTNRQVMSQLFPSI